MTRGDVARVQTQRIDLIFEKQVPPSGEEQPDLRISAVFRGDRHVPDVTDECAA